jgi:hypothetical protein
VKKAAVWYIEKSENLAYQAIELQEKSTWWAKENSARSVVRGAEFDHAEVYRAFGFCGAEPLADSLASSARLSPATHSSPQGRSRRNSRAALSL